MILIFIFLFLFYPIFISNKNHNFNLQSSLWFSVDDSFKNAFKLLRQAHVLEGTL